MSVRRPWAWPLVPAYRAALGVSDSLRQAALLPSRRLGWPVISVGSLSAGGAGKTPVTMALARLLRERGWVVDVLSRGYGRSGRGVEQVDALLPEAARRFGDEPTLIAQRTGVPVWVGANRFAAGSAAEEAARRTGTGPAGGGDAGQRNADQEVRGGPMRVHLLDDGMQHRALARSFELVLVTAEDVHEALLPAGNLREPLRALRRADALVVREDELKLVERPVRAMVGGALPLWTVRRSLEFPAPLGVFGAGLRPLAFCGVARPEGFAASLEKAGCGVVDTVVFADHQRYDDRDVAELITLGKRLEATGFVTTEKDAVKLHPGMLAKLEAGVGPVMVAALETSFVFESPVMRLIESRLRPAGEDSVVGDAVSSR